MPACLLACLPACLLACLPACLHNLKQACGQDNTKAEVEQYLKKKFETMIERIESVHKVRLPCVLLEVLLRTRATTMVVNMLPILLLMSCVVGGP